MAVYSRRRKQGGQSLVLFALMIVFLIGMIGLSVDVGNAFGQERRIQNATNAAAVAGMNSALVVGSTNKEVWTNVRRTLAGNQVNTTGPAYIYYADYVLDDGSKQFLGEWNGSTTYIENEGGSPPTNLTRIQITMQEDVETFFVRAFGREAFTVSVNGNACIGGYDLGVMAMGVPLNLIRYTVVNGVPQPYHRVYNTNGSELATTDPAWGVWDKMVKRTITLPVENWSDSMSGTHVAWLSWKGNDGAGTLAAAMTYPGTINKGFNEGPVLDTKLPNSLPLKKLTLGDWVNGDTGTKASLKDELQQLKTDKREIGLPMYDIAGRQNGKTSFHVVKVGLFRVADFDLTNDPGFIRLEYLGDKRSAPTECAGEPNQDMKFREKKRYTINGNTDVNRVWGSSMTSDTSYDIVVVMDTSTSMSWDWNDNDSGYAASRLAAAKKALNGFVRSYDLTKDPDARMSFVTFGGTGLSSAPTQVSWATSGCTLFQITSTLCTDDKKWAPLQTKINAMVANGYTPGPLAFEKVELLLKDKRTPPAGKRYGQIVLFATDGVFNVCGHDTIVGGSSCPAGQLVPFDKSLGSDPMSYLNNPQYNLMPGRPVWQGQQVAQRIKQAGARIFVVALTPRTGAFSPKGLPEMSSGTNYYFEADDTNTLTKIYSQIDLTIKNGTCIPFEQLIAATGAKITLVQPGNPNATRTTTADASGNWSFGKVAAGSYQIKVDTLSVKSPEDGITRQYVRVVNLANPNEEGQVSLDITAERPNGAIYRAPILMTMDRDKSGALQNGCSIP